MKRMTVLSMCIFMAALVAQADDVTSDTVVIAEEGVPGGVIANITEATATVKAVDAGSRKVTLALSGGAEETFVAGPEVANFDQIEVGDELKIKAVESIAVSMLGEDDTAENSAVAGAALAPLGDKPGLLIGGAVEIHATVESIDLEKRQGTLKFADGETQLVTVRDDVDLTKIKIGDGVKIEIVKALSIVVE